MAALIVIDMQRAIDAAYWAAHGPRNHRNAEETGQRLLAAWRRQGQPVYHVRHDSVEPQSSYRPGQPGNEFKPGFEPLPHEPVIPKHTGSAFTNTGFANLLRDAGIEDLTVFGVITNNSVETSVRHAATLGFRVKLVEDACFTFGKHDPFSGTAYPAETVHALSLANLDGEYATITTAADLLAGIPGEPLILPYFERPASFCEHDPRALAAAARISGFEHAGSTSVPGCPGKGILDGIVAYEHGTLDAAVARLRAFGFQSSRVAIPGRIRDPCWPEPSRTKARSTASTRTCLKRDVARSGRCSPFAITCAQTRRCSTPTPRPSGRSSTPALPIRWTIVNGKESSCRTFS
jgi:nicotinamidase-related amidase